MTVANDVEEFLATIPGGPSLWKLVSPAASDLRQLPRRWLPLVTASDPVQRCAHALSLWNSDFGQMLPRFNRIFPERLTDVRAFARDFQNGDTQFVLVYFAGRDDYGKQALWFGWDPALYVASMPDFFARFPQPVRSFLRTVHAGFTAQDWESYGITRPDSWESFEGYDWFPDRLHEETGVDPAHLMWFTRDAGQLYYCINTDLPPGQVTLAYEGDVDPPKDFAEELDSLMAERWPS